MNLFVAWRDSLTILQPKNLKLFLLVTLKSMVDAIKVWIKYFFWIPVYIMGKIALYSYFYQNPTPEKTDLLISLQSMLASIPWPVLFFLIPSLVCVSRATMLLSTRPSTAIKNCAYFRSYFVRAAISILLFHGLMDVMGRWVGVFIVQQYPACVVSVFCGCCISAIGLLLAIYAINYALFFFDGDGSVGSFLKSWIYAAKMTLYNLPFYGLFILFHVLASLTKTFIFLYSVKYVGGQSVMLVIAIPLTLMFAFLEVFTICFLTNFYVKKLHDQFTLYFGKND